ncbi:MAG: ABC transporter permease [Luteibacter sp.]
MSVWLAEAWRSWRASGRRPGFLLLAAGVLALGVGASAAVFTLIDQVLLRPLPFADAGRLLVVGPIENGRARHAAPDQYRYAAGTAGLTSIGLMLQLGAPSNISGDGEPEVVDTMRVDRGMLPTLGVRPILGRSFTAQEDTPNGPPVVILTYAYWQHRFAGDTGVLGRSLQVEGIAHAIVGVLPRGFAVPGARGDILLPLALPANHADGSNYLIIARRDAAYAADSIAAAIDARLHAAYASVGDTYWIHWHFGATDLGEVLHARSRPVLGMFLASATLLLLIALVNLTNLMLLRALSRTHDLAVRGALGAPTLRLVLPTLAEGLLVGIVGSVLGIGLAMLGVMLLQGIVPLEWTEDRFTVGAPVCVAAFLLGIGGASLAAVLGVRRARAEGSIDALREGGRLGAGRASGRLGRILVMAQVAMATALLAAAGVFLHTLYDLSQVPLGFGTQGVLTFELGPVKSRYPDAQAVQVLSARLTERLHGIPGVRMATGGTNLPAGDIMGQFNTNLALPGKEQFNAQYRGIDENFFATFDIPLREGRGIQTGDVRGGEPVAVVSQALASRRFGGRAVGQRIDVGVGKGKVTARIVGVVGDTLQFGPAGEVPEILYVPLAQMPDDMLQVFRGFEPMRFALNTRGDPESYRAAVHAAVAEIAPAQPIANITTMTRIVRATTADIHTNLVVIGVFAGLALLLAVAGLYAVMAVAVASREREFGVRLALGEPTRRLMLGVLRAGLAQIGIGLAFGVAMALASSQLTRAMLLDIGRDALDPVALVAVCSLLTVAGLLACLPSAWRASRTPPMRALRGD